MLGDRRVLERKKNRKIAWQRAQVNSLTEYVRIIDLVQWGKFERDIIDIIICEPEGCGIA